jgi:hypothetical protein
MNFEERINEQRALWLLHNFNEDMVKQNLPEAEQERFSCASIKKILLHYDKNGGINKVVYSKSPKDVNNILRDFASPSIQGLPTTFRGFLCDGIMTDIDMVNCHPTILLNLCKKHNIECEYLENYCLNRKKLIAERKVDKILTISAINDYRPLKNVPPFMAALDNEIKSIQKQLSLLPDFKMQLDMATESCKSKRSKNIIGTFMSNVLTTFEAKILHACIPFVQKMGIEIGVLMFDGFMIYGGERDNLLSELSKHIKDTMDIDMSFSYKAHDCGQLFMPDGWTPPNTKSDYDKMKFKYETTFKLSFIVDIVAYSYFNGDQIIFYNREQIKQILYPVKVGEKRFIDLWIDDENRLTYKKVDIIPHDRKCPEDVLNLWCGFAVANITDFTPVDIAPILNHIKIQMNNNEECFEFILNWLANMFQFPSSPSVLVSISTENGGTGKGLFVDLIQKMMGSDKYKLVDDVANRLFGRFNGDLQGKVLVHIDEPSAKDLNPYYERLKAMVTSDTITLEDKGQKPITISNTIKYIGTSNHLQAFKIKEGDRRVFSVEGSEELRGNMEYFEMFGKIVEDKNYLRSFYDFLMARKVKTRITHKDFPETQLMKEAKVLNRDPVEDFVDEIPIGKEITSDDLYPSYKQFITRTGLEFTLAKKQFEMKFGRLLNKYNIESKRKEKTEEDDEGNKIRRQYRIYVKR